MEPGLIKDIAPYIAAVVAMTGWFITNALNRKQKKYDFFIATLEKQVNQLNGPIFYRIKSMMTQQDRKKKLEDLLDTTKYLASTDSPIFVEIDSKLLSIHNQLIELYYKYEYEPTKYNKLLLCKKFALFYAVSSDTLRDKNLILTRQYSWLYRMSFVGTLKRIVMESFKFIIECMIPITQILLILWIPYFILYFQNLMKESLFITDILNNYGILILCNIISLTITIILFSYDFVFTQYKIPELLKKRKHNGEKHTKDQLSDEMITSNYLIEKWDLYTREEITLIEKASLRVSRMV
ncbi:hypothetical protein PTI45_02369 [Paenibacillus nuruki]|uniref:Uncharacterized protein n=1 Tax=Paenibacillus nuruki TaxID=1886670 RepID=A0A1E3L327_9BACL|nr:hypothetical protein [Paenibacillus nuruki]ODP28212.1 hypothetical protein PTI45_02369 [Paenibacillus nuruki]